MENISHVLNENGYEWIDGLTPASNVGEKNSSKLLAYYHELISESLESDLNIQGNTGKNQENIEEDSFNESDYNKLIDDLTNENNLDNTTVGTSRREQGLLRRYLFNNNEFSRCGICNHEYPVNMLVAAHIKKRASCTTKECLDYKNITMPMCKMGCDDLYEKGYIYVEDGKIIRNPEKESSITPKIRHYLLSIGDKKCNY